jgi:hypothetical protein
MITEIEILIVAEQVAEKERGVEAERERGVGVGIEVETGVEAGKGVEVEVREIVFQRVTGTMEDQDLEVASMISGIGRKEGTETERREGIGIGTGTETGSCGREIVTETRRGTKRGTKRGRGIGVMISGVSTVTGDDDNRDWTVTATQ